MATKYDPEIIQKLADQLYNQANIVVFVWTCLLLAVGGGGGALAATAMHNNEIILFLAGVGGLIGGLLGLAVGQSRAFLLRVQAQIALCQRQIEENTRIRN